MGPPRRRRRRRRRRRSRRGRGAGASWWEVLSRSLGPPLVPPRGAFEGSRVGKWLDRHTIGCTGGARRSCKSWREREERRKKKEGKKVPLAVGAR